jgi:hypothetical protein
MFAKKSGLQRTWTVSRWHLQTTFPSSTADICCTTPQIFIICLDVKTLDLGKL